MQVFDTYYTAVRLGDAHVSERAKIAGEIVMSTGAVISYYFDHSVVNAIKNGQHQDIVENIVNRNAVLLFSRANIEQIHDGTDQQPLLDVLKKLDAKVIDSDKNDPNVGPQYGNQTIEDVLADVEESTVLDPLLGFGLNPFFQIIMGGLKGYPISEIRDEALREFERLADALQSETDLLGLNKDLPNVSNLMKAEFSKAINSFYTVFTNELENNTVSSETLFGLSSNELNNIQAPGAIESIFGILESKMPGVLKALDAERYIQNEITNISDTDIFVLVIILNFVGYYRERKLRSGKRQSMNFRGMLSDASHIAKARHSNAFFTLDKAQAMHAAAIFDHLSIKTIVFLYKVEKESWQSCHIPEYISVRSF